MKKIDVIAIVLCAIVAMWIANSWSGIINSRDRRTAVLYDNSVYNQATFIDKHGDLWTAKTNGQVKPGHYILVFDGDKLVDFIRQ